MVPLAFPWELPNLANSLQKERRKKLFKINEKSVTELSKKVAKVLGKDVSKKSISRTTGKVIPLVGGAINATFAYLSLKKIGDNLVKNMMKEHIEVKPNVIYYWREEH